jgi:hypothetical protein
VFIRIDVFIEGSSDYFALSSMPWVMLAFALLGRPPREGKRWHCKSARLRAQKQELPGKMACPNFQKEMVETNERSAIS